MISIFSKLLNGAFSKKMKKQIKKFGIGEIWKIFIKY